MNKSRAVLELVLAITFYVVILIISLKALTHIENQSLKVLVSLLPVLPVILVIWVLFVNLFVLMNYSVKFNYKHSPLVSSAPHSLLLATAFWKILDFPN